MQAITTTTISMMMIIIVIIIATNIIITTNINIGASCIINREIRRRCSEVIVRRG